MADQFVCAECGYPSLAASGCDNPACLANPTISEEHKQKMRERSAARVAALAEEEERRAFKRRLAAAGFISF